MRHRKGKKKLNRSSSPRKALLCNLLKSLFRYERIRTTAPRAKELVKIAEHLITLAKEDKVPNRRYAFAYLQDKSIVGKLFKTIGPRNLQRKGGYSRTYKIPSRSGDAAPLALIQLL